MNSIVVSGNVGESKVSIHGERKLVKFSLAVNDSVYVDGEWKNNTVWFNVDYWVSAKSKIDEQIKKGVGIIVLGKMVTNKHDEKTYWTLKADRVDVTFSGKSPENSSPMPTNSGY